jgi:hypothetical protein
MITEAKNVVENLLKPSSFQTLTDDEWQARERELLARSQREKGIEYLAKSGIPSRHRNTPPSELRGAPWLGLKSKIETRLGDGLILALVGRRGTGKTQLAVEVAKVVAMAGKRPLYSTAMEFFLSIKECYRESGGSERRVIENYTIPALLILDEVQERGETPWEDRLLTHLVDRRYQAQKDTILISNQTREAFLAAIGDSISSRIVEAGGVAVCDWESYRK